MNKTTVSAVLGLLALGAAVAPATAMSKLEKQSFQADYRQAIQYYAGGDVGAALEQLMAAEAATIDDLGADMEKLYKAELAVIRDLVETDLEISLALALLHERAYLAYLAVQRRDLAVQSRIMAADLVHFFGDRTRTPYGRILASQVLTSLAGYMHENYLDTGAVRLYNAALQLDRTNPAALIGVAAALEKHGRYDSAVAHLERGVAAHPEQSELRLRLAVNLARVYRAPEAMKILKHLIRDEREDWVTSVAYQELGRLLMDEGEVEKAREVLEQGIERLPDDPTLPIQLAYVTELSGQRWYDMATPLRSADTTAEISPRYVYSRMPRQALEVMREELAEYRSSKQASLAQALNGGAVHGAGG